MKNKSIIQKIIVFSAIVVLLIATGIIASFASGASTYFVDGTSGLDTNDGTTESTAFKTINYAVNNVPTGSTVKLLTDFTYSNITGTVISFPANKEITLNLNEKKISGNASDTIRNGVFNIPEDANATIKNGTIEFSGPSAISTALITIKADKAKLVLDGLNISSTENSNVSKAITLMGTKFEKGEYEIKNCKIFAKQTQQYFVHALYVSNFKSALIEDTEVHLTHVQMPAETVFDPICVQYGNLKLKGKIATSCTNTGAVQDNDTHINLLDVNLDVSEIDNTVQFGKTKLSNVRVSGNPNNCFAGASHEYTTAYFKIDPTSLELKTGLYKYANTDVATKTDYPYAIGSVAFEVTSGSKTGSKYNSFTNLTADIGKEKSSVKLLKKIDEKLTVEDGHNIELDLNGFEINRSVSADPIAILVKEGGKITISDSSAGKSGSVYSKVRSSKPTTDAIALSCSGETVIKGGIFIAENGLASYPIKIENKGKVTVDGGYINGSISNSTNGTLTLNAGFFTFDPSSLVDPFYKKVVYTATAETYKYELSTRASKEYFVDPVNGVDTNSGSEIAPVQTIQKAIDIATDGSTIKLVSDVTYTNITGSVITFPADKKITLDLNGKKISGNASSGVTNGAICCVKNSNVTIKNGTLEFVGSTNGMFKTISANEAKVVLDGLTIKDTENCNSAYVVSLIGSQGTTGEYEVKNCKIEVTQNSFAYAYPIFVNNSKSVVIEDNEVDITASDGLVDSIHVGNTSLAKIKGSHKYTITSTGLKQSIAVNNSTLDLTEFDNTIVFTNPYISNVKVEGDVNTCFSDDEGTFVKVLLKNKPTLTALPTGVEVYSNTVSETKTEYPYVLGTPIFVVTSGTKKDNKYETVEDMLADIGTAKSGVKMLGEMRGMLTVSDGMDLELDLNGFKLFKEVGGNNDAVIISVEEGAKFLLKDSSNDKTGTVYCKFKTSTTAKAIALRSAGEAIVESGILICEDGASNYSVDVVGNGSALIKGGKFPCLLACAEDATLKVEGGSFANDPKDYVDATKSMVINNTGATVYFFSVAAKIINPPTGDNSASSLMFWIVLSIAFAFTTATIYVVKRKEN